MKDVRKTKGDRVELVHNFREYNLKASTCESENALPKKYSDNEGLKQKFGSRWRDSNPRSADYESAALPG
jgi:hypothetical protein